ncbi:MAG: bifunctional riboflavin kinase/FAD synthetase [Desulfuromonadales bacterium]|nr:bifunctional riboflavin kinase/FAD synthetase [Desulfuromonadales bacterium]
MRVVTGPDIGNEIIHDSVVTIGNFDGVHRGHLELFRRLIACGFQLGLQSLVVTFEPHPLKVLSPETTPPMITTFDQKVALIDTAGVDCLVVVPFTLEFAQMTADAFVRDFLCHSLGMRHIVIGHDYAFGKGRAGNYTTLERVGAEQGFSVEYMEPVGEDGLVFSSSLVRRLITAGDMAAASMILGRYHMISGTVVHGREIGHAIGFPTANIATDNELLPPDGVYAVMVSVAGRLVVKGACNIGLNPTFDGGTRTIEVFLLDYSDRIYGLEIALWFVQRLRDVQKFADVAALVEAITLDVQHTREVLAAVELRKIEPAVRMGLNEIET